jgi:hypothetical protein
MARVTFEPSQTAAAPLATDSVVGTAAIMKARSATRGVMVIGRPAQAALSPNQATKPTAPPRYKPVHRAQTGSWCPSTKNDRSGIWWQITAPIENIIKSSKFIYINMLQRKVRACEIMELAKWVVRLTPFEY